MAELQVQTWGSTAQEMQATALRLLDINPELLTVRPAPRPDRRVNQRRDLVVA
jgi:hypothetical protein